MSPLVHSHKLNCHNAHIHTHMHTHTYIHTHTQSFLDEGTDIFVYAQNK
jgi:hypothetical protein